ncbi:MAG TPA: DNA-processing protein DprA [Thermodesulfobacteriota bacterium]
MGRRRLEYWLALSMLRGIERMNVGTLLETFGSPEEIFSAGGNGFEGATASFSKSMREFDAWDRVEREIEQAGKNNIRIVPFDDPGYPALLRRTFDPPCLLYMKGNVYREDLPAVAIVGTRQPSHYGLKMAETLGRELAYSGALIVSGMARGCDTAAHRGALSADGFTAAVLGTGVDMIYPGESKKLYGEIAEKGVLISEYPMSTPPLQYNFPRRNRIISGLSLGVVVVEAPQRSGSLMTARLSLEYGRDVFAVPGQATSYKSSGTNKLIKEGAALVESAADVAVALSITPFSRDAKDGGQPVVEGDEALFLDALEEGPMHIDGLLERTGVGAARAATVLLQMELKGYVEQKPGKQFVRRI